MAAAHHGSLMKQNTIPLSVFAKSTVRPVKASAPYSSPYARGLCPVGDDEPMRPQSNYKKHGSVDGHDMEAWLRAESEYMADYQRANSR
jgi:hypothetical protein